MSMASGFLIAIIFLIKMAAVVAALWVFWPSQRPGRLLGLRVLVFFIAIGTFAGLTIWKPAKIEGAGNPIVSAFSFVTCQSGDALWCFMVKPDGADGNGNGRGRVKEQDGRTFRDCPMCPRVVAIPQKEAVLLSMQDAQLAVGVYEVSVEEYTVCIEEGSCEPPIWLKIGSPFNIVTGTEKLYSELGDKDRSANVLGVKWDLDVSAAQYFDCVYNQKCPEELWEKDGGKFNVTTEAEEGALDVGEPVSVPNVPIVGVTWHEAQQYIAWLNKKTGADYRLLTSEEWEYITTAGFSTISSFAHEDEKLCRFWGVRTGAQDAVADNMEVENCLQTISRLNPIAAYAANAYGLHGLQSNAWEWMSDCIEAPDTRRSRENRSDECQRRVLRGGANTDSLYVNGSSYSSLSPDDHYPVIGFRVAKVFD